MYECMYALHEQVVSYDSIRLSSLNNRTNIETTRSKVILSFKKLPSKSSTYKNLGI